MADSHSSAPPGSAASLEVWLAEFRQDWRPDKLSTLLPRLPADAQRRPVLVALVAFDLQQQWQRGARVPVEAYLERYPELGAPREPPVELIQAEIELRRQFAAPATFADLVQRFPTRAEELRRCLEPTVASLPSAANPSANTDVLPPRTAGTVLPHPHSVTGQANYLGPGIVPDQFGRYRILRPLGKGGMGTVYLAHDEHLGRDVALKVPHIVPDDGPEVLARFHTEARAAATLHHPFICPVYDVGQIDGIPYLTMAFIDGHPLSDRVKGRKQLDQRAAARIVRQVALAMQEAHNHGMNIIHRDLKPSNILMNRREEPVVMDFGVARRLNEQGERLTRTGRLVGTPEYMAPEQAKADPDAAGPACDIWSLGVILYRLVTGRLPYEGALMEVLIKLATEEPPPARTYRPDLDDHLARIIRQAIARDLGERFRSMTEFAAALEAYEQAPVQPPPAVEGDVSELPTQGGTLLSPIGSVQAPPKQVPVMPLPQPEPAPLPQPSADTSYASLPTPGPLLRPPPPPRPSALPLKLVIVLLLTLAGGGAYWFGAQWYAKHGRGGPVAADAKRGQFEAGQEALQRQDYDQAIARFTEVLRLDPAYGLAYRERGKAHAGKGASAAAIEDFTRALTFPAQQTAETYRLRGLALAAKADDTAALADLTAALDRAPADSAALAARAEIAFRQQRYDAALADARAARQLDPALPLADLLVQAYAARGRQFAQAGDRNRALDCFTRGLELGPKHEGLLLARGDVCLADGNFKQAIDDFTTAWRGQRASPAIGQRLDQAYQGFADQQLKGGDFKGALDYLDERLKLDPDNARALYQRGRVFLDRAGSSDSELAVADLTRAVQLNAALAAAAQEPLDNAYRRYFELYFAKNPDAAIAEFTRRMDAGENNFWTAFYRGRAYQTKGDQAAAAEDFTQALKANPRDALAYRHRGDARAAQRQWADAGADFRQATTLQADDVRSWSQHLHLLLAENDLDSYRRDCRKVVERFARADDPATLNLAAWLQALVADPEADAKQAVALATRAWEKDRDNVFWRNTLAAALLRAQEYGAAVKHLQDVQAWRKQTGDQRGNVNDWIILGLAYGKQHAPEAKEWLERALRGIGAELKLASTSWARRVELEHLRREVEETLKTAKK